MIYALQLAVKKKPKNATNMNIHMGDGTTHLCGISMQINNQAFSYSFPLLWCVHCMYVIKSSAISNRFFASIFETIGLLLE